VENSFRGGDFSLIRVPHDKKNAEFATATLNEDVPFDKELVSIGCDLGIVPKAFQVKTVKWRDKNKKIDFWCESKKDEEVLAGRSGEGLFDGRKLVGVLWGRWHGTSEDGIVNGAMFTSARLIIKLLKNSELNCYVD
jgi:hypothetical protein